MGSHNRFNKSSTNEEAIRIPMIYRWPGTLPAGSEPSCITQLIDIMPTLLDLCGLPAVHNLQGTSMVPVLHGDSADEERNDVFLETSNGQVALRTERYMYSVQLGDRRRRITNDALEFYDLREDPFELHNLVGSVEHAATAQRLRKRVVSWNRDTPWFGP
jgi:arylsulfatase A-like enzyme